MPPKKAARGRSGSASASASAAAAGGVAALLGARPSLQSRGNGGAVAAAPAPGGSAGPRLAPGSRARLFGLQSDAVKELNGQAVELKEWVVEKERWRCVTAAGRIVNVKQENLALDVADHDEASPRRSPRLQRPQGGAASPAAAAAAAPAAGAGARAGGGRGRGRGLQRAASMPPAVKRGSAGEEAMSPPAESPQLRRRLGGRGGQQSEGTASSWTPAASSSSAAGGVAAVGQSQGALQPRGKRTVEEIYQKKTQLEHILLRPDSYVGSMERQSQELWVLEAVQSGGSSGSASAASSDPAASGDGRRRMVRRKLEYIPALYKIFDEILVNAADNLIRDPSMDTIKVQIDRAAGSISVWNNGRGLPVEIHKEHKCYVPELVFGQLLTSDNYDDSERKVVGGRNGYGAKLTNIFSSRFSVETADNSRGRRFQMTWQRNMSQRGEPVVNPFNGEDFTCVTFSPDLPRFGMKELEADIVALMRRRAYDVAASTRGRCSVYLDGELLEVKSFEDYVGLYLEPNAFRVSRTLGERWEVAIAVTDGSGFQQVSFVNSICTTRGGTHVRHVEDQLVPAIMEKLSSQKGDKGQLTMKPQHVRSFLWIFVNCLIENPAFDSQTKDTLTTKKERFGSTCTLPEDMVSDVLGSGIMDALIQWSRALGKSELARHLNKSEYGLRSRLFGIPKLEDANKAGTKFSNECTLILTEGDSAKALAVAGLGVIGRDRYGVFPLRGKLRNVRDLTVKQMMENKEVEQLAQILALDATKQYETTAGLRYGSVMIMTDQDYDGSHIKGLVINLIQHWFPGLLKLPGFLKEFVTPIVKATRGDEVVTFFTIPEYEAWKQANDDGRSWKCKYYKGLGTSTSAEARDYFGELQDHELSFRHSDEGNDEDLIDMAFSAKRADDRKEWISACEEGTYVDHSQSELTYKDFVQKELVLFAKYDVERMIPSLVDGLKPGQRKVLFGAFKKKITSDIKVAQMSGYVAEHSSYHHGEVSLQGTIIGMAQTYVGSNNLNLLVPSGQFGTRMAGGKDHAASRYIFTRLAPVTRRLFPDEDDPVLEYLQEEGSQIEPRWYCPVIPLVLVNGAEGIGVGWSTSVPNYNPRDIVANLRRHMRGEALEPMLPWYRGFKGTITAMEGEKQGRFEVSGVIHKRSRTRVEITELPIRRWTQDYKEWLLDQVPKADAEKRSTILDFREHHTDNTVHFSINVAPDKLVQAESKAGGLEKYFHLKGNLTTSNMYLFDVDGKLQKYATPEDILVEFAKVRLDVYRKRKDFQIKRFEGEAALLSDKAKFVRLVVDGQLEVSQRAAKDVCRDMRRHGLRTMRELRAIGPQGDEQARATAREEADAQDAPQKPADNGKDGYGFLLNMKLWTLTEDRLKQLEAQLERCTQALEELRGTTPEQLWERDLVALDEALDQREAEEAKEQKEADRLKQKDIGEDLDDGTKNRQCVLVISKALTIKRVRTGEWRTTRRRGGRGMALQKVQRPRRTSRGANAASGANGGDEEEGGDEGAEAAEGDQDEGISGAFPCREFDALLAFTEHGYVSALQALDVPLRRRMQEGSSLVELLPGLADTKHRIVAVLSVPQETLKMKKTDSTDGDSVVLVTAHGQMKRIALSAIGSSAQRAGRTKTGWCSAIQLADGDELVFAQRASSQDLATLVSRAGFVLSFKVGQGFARSSGLGVRGKPGMKLLSGDTVAALDIARQDPGEAEAEERQAVVVAKPKKARSAFQFFITSTKQTWTEAGKAWAALSEEERKPFEAEAKAAKDALASQQPGAPAVGSKRSRNQVDDDDSEGCPASPAANGGGSREPAAASASKADAEMEAEGAAEEDEADQDAEPDQEEDDEDGDAMDVEDENEGEEAAAAGEEEDGAASAVAAPEAAGGIAGGAVRGRAGLQRGPQRQCALIVTELGYAKRVRLSEFRLGRRGARGMRGVKLSEGDAVVSLCIVPDGEIPPIPRKPREPWMLYQEHLALQEKAAAVGAPESAPAPVEAQQASPSVDPAAAIAAAEARYAALPEAERAEYERRHAAEVETHAGLVERRRQREAELSKLGQVLLCTSKGMMSRVQLSSVGVLKKSVAGRGPLMKMQGDDIVQSASLISALDEDDRPPESGAAEPPGAAPAAVAAKA
eukprot:TRINITY_DN13680_c0_g2_i2.p1 TRINITY_DN13680_c0_g2~~TRINITY_DN13680_c0_g2_i2.p1  ORF type:complete len:2124 (+),score=527.12 TRINITY_DN13680_c0_g2_i2:96-6467(+)